LRVALTFVANSSARNVRVGEQIQKELATLISTEAKDPRIRQVTLTGVDLSPDMRYARVMFTTLDGGAVREAALLGLQRSTSFFRARLSALLSLRVMPRLQFVYDNTVERGAYLSHLIDTAIASGPRNDSSSGN
jgi:ribosome-binding factor A